jgi:hypothetical protein
MRAIKIPRVWSGISHASFHGAVVGINDNDSGSAGPGVYGESKGTGVWGQSKTWMGVFGHSESNVFAKNWLPQLNMVHVEGNGKRPKTTRLTLSPFERVATVRPQVAVIHFTQPFATSYFIDYRRASGWDRGLAQDAVVVRQYRADGNSYYAGKIATSVGFAGGVTLLAERFYLDTQFDLSIEVHRILADGQVDLTVAPAAAVQTLSVRTVARDKLGLNGGFSIRGSILRPATTSLRQSLVEILGN